ncbi:hypothetical protein C439_00050 [Haloferax mediterranei ATCC 33500]|uniref:Uncharacterized protein n=1 Tax=Haloferax mediterranei (strain ATCC 33500 / DSM 1411 / JCM 8866 / NBRC 14739 / NCIMB 2177 / R-4) TaxID=523841 RepID=M0J9X6_HALMT|nr:hypothetical protein BM92_17840 [Haloferax mediterranei ATCC 33500]EMA05143.1 hypothetical protein C439_00050 [Haloferax mediterranei ATCC 33500]
MTVPDVDRNRQQYLNEIATETGLAGETGEVGETADTINVADGIYSTADSRTNGLSDTASTETPLLSSTNCHAMYIC